MKILLSIFIIFLLLGCSKTYHKPFVIIRKEFVFTPAMSEEKNRINSNKCIYTYIDKYGNETEFQDYDDRYNIGDTIK